MVDSQNKPNRKASGGRLFKYRKKKSYELGGNNVLTRLGEKKVKVVPKMASTIKFQLQADNTANVYNPKEKKYVKAKISSVIENPANRHYARRNALTKGTIIDTEAGKARILSRPGQDGLINAVLI